MAERAIRVPGLESHDAVLDIVLACNHNPQRITWLQEIVFAGGLKKFWRHDPRLYQRAYIWLPNVYKLEFPDEPERTGETDV